MKKLSELIFDVVCMLACQIVVVILVGMNWNGLILGLIFVLIWVLLGVGWVFVRRAQKRKAQNSRIY